MVATKVAVADYSYGGYMEGLITDIRMARGLGFESTAIFQRSKIDFEVQDELARTYEYDRDGSYNSVGWFEDTLVHLSVNENTLYAQASVYGKTRADVDKVMSIISENVDEVVVTNDDVPVNFWTGPRGNGSVRSRGITVPTWDNIRDNYSDNVRDEIDWLSDPENVVNGSGKLILWHGPPGAGKTYALRSLMRSWKEHFGANYIIDPENFFGSGVDYMLDVLMYEDYSNRKPWKLIILEDTGELLSADAKDRAGQGLSRLLNVVDGMIGQGIQATFLITTNEKLNTLHPAVTRPGRCLSKILFDKLSVEKSNKWLAGKGSDLTVREERSVAELYAFINNNRNAPADDVEIKQEVSTGLYI